LAKYAEQDEEDYDDMFDEKPSLGQLTQSIAARAKLISRIYQATIAAAYQAFQFVMAVR